MKLSKKIRKKITNNLAFLAVLMFRRLFLTLSIENARKLALNIGKLVYIFAKSERNRSLKQLMRAYPQMSQEQARQTVRKMFIHFCFVISDMVNAKRLFNQVDKYFFADPESLEVLKAVQNSDKASIFITAHLGNWELLAMYTAYQAGSVDVVAKKMYDKRIEDIVLNTRKSLNVNTHITEDDKSGIGLLRKLRKKGIIGMLIDQDTNLPSVFVDFFGQKAYTPSGPAQLALRGKHKVATGFSILKDDGTYQISFGGPFDLIDTGDKQKDIITNTAMFTNQIEQHIRQAPWQWPWFHKRWKTQPPV